MDEEEDHLSDTQINETQTNNILLTESQMEKPESDKKDRKRKSEDGDESPIPKKGYLLLYILQILHSLEQEGLNLKRKRTLNRKMNSYNMIQIKWNLKRIQ